jgi:hypothetical protein
MKQKMKVSEFRDEFFESERDCAAAMGKSLQTLRNLVSDGREMVLLADMRTYMLSMNKKTVVTFEFD